MAISFFFNPFTGTFDGIDSGGSYWQDPVADFASLPATDPDGTSRIVRDEDAVYTYDAGSLTWIFAGKIKTANVGASPNAAGYVVAADNTLTLEPADGTHPGVITSGAQTIGGNKTFTGSIAASNFSGSSSGTNTGDVTLAAVGASPNANAASLSGQILNLQPADHTNPGVLTSGSQTIGGAKTLDDTLVLANVADSTKHLAFDLSGMSTGVSTTLKPLATANVALSIQPNVDATANILTQNGSSGQVFIGTNSTIGGSNSGIQYSDASTANRAQIKLHSYINATSVAGVSTLTSRSGTVGVNAAVVAGQDYSKWTAQAGATTAGSAPISGTWAFKANTVNSLTVTSDYHIQLTNLAGTLGDRLTLGSEGDLTVTGALAASNFSGSSSGTNTGDQTNITGNAGSATTVATTQVSTNATFFPLFVASSTNGNQAADLGTGLTFNPSTNNLTTTTFTGALSGNATTATTATNFSGSLLGDVTGTQGATVVSKIAGTTVSGTTGSGNVVFSASPTLTGTITAAAANFSGAISASNFSGSSSGTNTGDQTITLTGDVTGSGTGTFATTLATVNGNVGSFGSSTSIPSFTVNAKGLITAASGNVVIAPAGTLTGTTLNATVVSSSLTSVGTITSGTWNGTTIDVAHGGTGDTTLTAHGVLIGNGTSAVNVTSAGTSGQVLTSNGAGADPTFQTVASSSPTVFGSRASPLVITAGSGLVAATNVSTTALVQVSFIQGTGSAPVTITANPAIAAGTIVGQILYIIVPSPTAAASTVTIPNQSGAVELNGNWTGGPGDSLTVLWDGTAWTEMDRNT